MADMEIKEFEGFYKETLYFFRTLEENNNKPWFDQNRQVYEDYVVAPAKSFVVSMGEKLKKLAPGINADPRTNKSLFRINRDVRFSSDKSPYKTQMGIVFWDRDLPRMESSVFYFHLEHERVMLGAGIYRFTKPRLEEYRKSVVHPVYGKELGNIYKELSGKGYDFGGKKYKKIPSGFDGDHENAGLLLYEGLYASKDFNIPREFYSRDFLDFCFEPYKEMLPLQEWLSRLTERA